MTGNGTGPDAGVELDPNREAQIRQLHEELGPVRTLAAVGARAAIGDLLTEISRLRQAGETVAARTREQLTEGEPVKTPPGTTTQRIEYALTSPKYALHGPYLIQARDLQEAALVAADDSGSQIVQRTVITTTTPWSKAGEDQ